ncbi:hypothetical protein H312_03147 [Anncaliia algerae PRA339]|uniref:EF-hand domain-containing protein n=1 Tax=Anncaliia algerae PRA339 TaxID=1288291 RepID=A0A059EX17_9MICR|nr:hypothetical protein H312_03147 [Anncaliia algerae PRA339]
MTLMFYLPKRIIFLIKLLYICLLFYIIVHGFNRVTTLFSLMFMVLDLKLMTGLFVVIIYKGYFQYLFTDKFKYDGTIDSSDLKNLIDITEINVKEFIINDPLVEFYEYMNEEYNPPE